MDQRGNRSLGGLCASITPRYQTATFRPVRPPVLPAYAPVDRMPVRVAENGVRIGRGCDALRSSTWQSQININDIIHQRYMSWVGKRNSALPS